MDPNTWPKFVRVREFVYKTGNTSGIGVTIQNFVEKVLRNDVHIQN